MGYRYPSVVIQYDEFEVRARLTGETVPALGHRLGRPCCGVESYPAYQLLAYRWHDDSVAPLPSWLHIPHSRHTLAAAIADAPVIDQHERRSIMREMAIYALHDPAMLRRADISDDVARQVLNQIGDDTGPAWIDAIGEPQA